MAFMKTNTVDITVNGKTYNSLRDFGLAIENTDYIGTPVQGDGALVYVKGRNGPLDTTDEVFGEQYFKSRPISIKFGGIEDPILWDMIIADFRNKFEGRIVMLEFLTTPKWYFTGRCQINKFKHSRALGTFTFEIPEADPYMYQDHVVTLTATSLGETIQIPITRKTAVPTITSSANIIITKDGTEYAFDSGTHKNEELRFTEGENVITITGSGTVTIAYRDGSL